MFRPSSLLAVMSLLVAGYALPAWSQAMYAQTYAPQPAAPQQLSDNTMAPVYASQPIYAAPVAQPQPVQPQAQNTGREGEYGSSLVTDLRQLNF